MFTQLCSSSCFFFFFSSRRRHTRCSRDWSSDVCSSDLMEVRLQLTGTEQWSQLELYEAVKKAEIRTFGWPIGIVLEGRDERSEERRVGKECRSRWSPYH